LAIEGGHGSRAVNADQPIGLSTRARGRFKRLHRLVAAQIVESFAYGFLRHGLQPQPLYRLFGARVLDYVAEDKLAFASGVASVNDAIDIFALDEAHQQFEAFLRTLVGRPQFELRRYYRQVGEGPF